MRRKSIVLGPALVAALVAFAWFVVLPAVAATAKSVLPASTGGVTPTSVSVNDAPNDCKVFYASGAPTYSFRIKDGTSKTYTDSATGATFTLKVNPGNPDSTGHSWTAYANNTYFSFTSTGAAIVDVGVDGANERDAARYNYSTQPGGVVTSDGYLHATAVKTNSDGSTKTLDGLDDMSFCYNKFAPISGTAFIDANGSGTNDDAVDPSAAGLTVTLFNGSGTSLGTTTTAADGTYTFAQEIVGAAYKVCIAAPNADANGYLQTLPTSGPACTAPASVGYAIAKLAASGQTKQDFGFEPLGSVAGTLFNDVNQDQSNDAGDSPLSGWTVTLYGGAQPVSMPSGQDGSYKFKVPFSTSTTYTLCETPTTTPPPPSDTWAQDVPLPSSTIACSGTNELPKGLQFTPQTVSDTIIGKDFGNVAAVTCNPTGSVPSPDPGDLRRQHPALELRHRRFEGAYRVRRRLRDPAERHAVRQRLDRRFPRRQGPAARAHQLPERAKGGWDASVHAPRVHGRVPLHGDPGERCRPARSTRGIPLITRSWRRLTWTRAPRHKCFRPERRRA